METIANWVFQIDSKIVQEAYERMDNYKIHFDPSGQKDLCAIYFASHNIYDPNNEKAFRQSIVEKNRFEWYETRIKGASKHIYVRDIHKQWYLTGINQSINSPTALLEFLKCETDGFRIVTIGSSAGGYAAVLYGQQLGAERIFSFNGQFEIHSKLVKSTADIDPIVFRNADNPVLRKYFDISWSIQDPASVFYFYSMHSDWDAQQASNVEHIPINRIRFSTSNHGIPFLKNNLPAVINMNREQLLRISGKKYHPITFSMQMIGPAKTFNGLLKTLEIVIRRKLKK